MDQISTLIRFLRHTRNLTQEALSETVGIDYRHYQRIESGNVSIRLETIDRIVTGLNMSLSEFFKVHDHIEHVKEIPPPSHEVALTLLALFLRAQNKNLPKQLYDHVLAYDDALRRGRPQELNFLPIPIFKTSIDGRILYLNEAAKEVYPRKCSVIRPHFLAQQCNSCSWSCEPYREAVPEPETIFQSDIACLEPKWTRLFFWGHRQSPGNHYYLTCICEDLSAASEDS
ncbi:helix-turn-helix domain-containing protein [Pseudobacteriovorax antillogorgiicola]|uniref:Helix-turn-helix n=1 Tax=Pseudobacteriovorax antillogorgiicola TaxID=1513793 RepID=A0A1Y6B9D2_9BACT|nr:helix-turn-helix transcriptional regulator [Pseudobacteriovorax antillogorgiicola]TCS58702.1 helix-turn-helix protein [Pseudobacteriovorax antillogorgiicola]SME95634.1 Helix-turn-helix [Pseudobacteriovorax antillogorgiicola]